MAAYYRGRTEAFRTKIGLSKNRSIYWCCNGVFFLARWTDRFGSPSWKWSANF